MKALGIPLLRVALACSGLALAAPASAQATNQASQAAATASAPTDRMQRDAASPLYWIKVLGDKPAAKAAPKAAPKAAAPATATATANAAGTPPAAGTVAGSAGAATGGAARAARGAAPGAAALPTESPAVAAVNRAGGVSLASAGVDPAPETTASAPGAEASPAIGVVGGLAASTSMAPALSAAEVPTVEEADPGLILVSAVDPQFAPATMRRLRKGAVEVRFEVSPEGQVTDVTVLKTTHRTLDQTALDAVRQWKFKPGPVGHTASVELAFDMDR
jgi:TonB family protein